MVTVVEASCWEIILKPVAVKGASLTSDNVENNIDKFNFYLLSLSYADASKLPKFCALHLWLSIFNFYFYIFQKKIFV